MASDHTSYEAQVAAEIGQEVSDLAAQFEVAIANMRVGEDGAGNLDRLKRQVASMRVLCAGIDDRLLELTIQRFANYLSMLSEPGAHQLDDMAVFVDMMAGLASGEIDAKADEAEFVRSLPVLRPADLDDIAHLDREVLIVDPNKVGARFVARELQNCGYRVTTVGRSYEALELAARTRPDLVITAAVLDEIDGVELCRMLRVAKATSHIPVAILTSFNSDDAHFKNLPADVRLLRKTGGTFARDMGDLLQDVLGAADKSLFDTAV